MKPLLDNRLSSLRLSRLYLQAEDQARGTREALERRLHEVRTQLPSWARQKDIEAAQIADPTCMDLVTRANQARATLNLRRQQFLGLDQ
jgi:hypothetical protein